MSFSSRCAHDRIDRELIKEVSNGIRSGTYAKQPTFKLVNALRAAAQRELELEAEVERLREDEARLRFLAEEPFCDVFGGIDLHEQAFQEGLAYDREEPNADDYLAAVRVAIDVARRALQEKGDE